MNELKIYIIHNQQINSYHFRNKYKLINLKMILFKICKQLSKYLNKFRNLS